MKRINFFLIFCLFSLLSAQDVKTDNLSNVALRDANYLEEVVRGNNTFAFNLFQQLKRKKGNLFFSPYNIAEGFAMAGVGAQGSTADEFQKVFQYSVAIAPLNGDLSAIMSAPPSTNTKGASELSIGAEVWFQNDVSMTPFYQQAIKQNFHATLEPVDFAHQPLNAVRIINQWVSNKTHGRISQLLTTGDISGSTKFMLTTAIYMKGSWKHQFNLKLTKREPFHINSKYSSTAEMMHVSDNFLHMDEQDVSMIELPYISGDKGAALAMYVILPATTNGLEKLENQFDVSHWEAWNKKLAMKKVNLSMPRFRDDEKIELNQPMKKLGLTEAFSEKANFTGITGERNIFISKAIHKTFIMVDEKGTEAAAATAIGMSTTSLGPVELPIEMKVDHPFLFLIVDKKTNSIVFMGRVSQP